MRLASCLHE
jgi:hypothetical protein